MFGSLLDANPSGWVGGEMKIKANLSSITSEMTLPAGAEIGNN